MVGKGRGVGGKEGQDQIRKYDACVLVPTCVSTSIVILITS